MVQVLCLGVKELFNTSIQEREQQIRNNQIFLTSTFAEECLAQKKKKRNSG